MTLGKLLIHSGIEFLLICKMQIKIATDLIRINNEIYSRHLKNVTFCFYLPFLTVREQETGCTSVPSKVYVVYISQFLNSVNKAYIMETKISQNSINIMWHALCIFFLLNSSLFHYEVNSIRKTFFQAILREPRAYSQKE